MQQLYVFMPKDCMLFEQLRKYYKYHYSLRYLDFDDITVDTYNKFVFDQASIFSLACNLIRFPFNSNFTTGNILAYKYILENILNDDNVDVSFYRKYNSILNWYKINYKNIPYTICIHDIDINSALLFCNKEFKILRQLIKSNKLCNIRFVRQDELHHFLTLKTFTKLMLNYLDFNTFLLKNFSSKLHVIMPNISYVKNFLLHNNLFDATLLSIKDFKLLDDIDNNNINQISKILNLCYLI